MSHFIFLLIIPILILALLIFRLLLLLLLIKPSPLSLRLSHAIPPPHYAIPPPHPPPYYYSYTAQIRISLLSPNSILFSLLPAAMASDPKPVVTGYPAAQPSYSAAAPGAAAYPYPAPPPPYYPQPAYYSAPGPRRPNTLLLRRLLFLLFAVFLLVGAATLLVRLVLRPRLPVLTVSSLRISSFNLSSSLLSSDFDLSLSVQNPNHKMSVSYDHVFASVLFGYDVLAETSVPPFYQAKRNSTVLHARMAAVGEYVDPDVADGISRQRSGGGAVGLDVRVSAVVRFRAGAWRTRSNVMRVFCGDVSVAFSNATASTGALTGPPKGCRVDL